MLKFLLKPKYVFYQVWIDLGKVNSFYSRFSDAGQKVSSNFQKFERTCLV